MRKALMSMFLGVTLLTAAANFAFAEMVYVTKYGKKYHHAESRFIKGKAEVREITVEEAQKSGFEPSSDYIQYKERLDLKTGELKTDADVRTEVKK